MKIIAAVLEEIDKPLAFHELEAPPLKEGQVLVEIHYSSICQSQINEIHGRKGEDRYLPHTLGHEGSGVVQEIGPRVTKVKPGDRVVISWIKGSGLNVPKTQYQSRNGLINAGAVSTFMTHAVISENRLVPFIGLPMDMASLFGCAIPTGAGVVLNNLKPQPGQSIAVWGAGGIGLAAIMMAKVLGCRPVIAVDIQTRKLEIAKSCGATEVVHGKESPVSKILELTDSHGVDYAIESAGQVETMEMGFAATKKNGGKFVITGNVAYGKTISIDPFDLITGKQIAGTWGGETNPERDFPRYIALFQDGKLPLHKMVTHRFPLEKINEAISVVESGQAGRVIIQTALAVKE